MSDNKNRVNKSRKKVIIILSLIFAVIILISFLYSLIGLIIEPTSIYIVENRKNISRRNNLWIYY